MQETLYVYGVYGGKVGLHYGYLALAQFVHLIACIASHVNASHVTTMKRKERTDERASRS